jgi:L-asparaginase II
VLAEVVRSGFVESVHRGSLVVLDADGSPALRAGTTDQPMFPRSASKPMQATAMLGCGLDLDGRLLALAAASHAGEEFHVTGVREILAAAGLTEADLQCPRDLPLDEAVREELLRAGGGADRVHMNCSGKHAAMLATCVAAGWPLAGYRDPDHPLQRQVKLTIEGLAGEQVQAVGVDGCGAPVLAISLSGLARAYRGLVLSEAGSAPRRVADAMRAYPAWTSGSAMPEAALMAAVPGLLMKAGAEGVCAFALADGRAAAVKIDDGTRRAVPPVMAAVLRDLIGEAADLASIERLLTTPVTGGGQPVGQIRPVP